MGQWNMYAYTFNFHFKVPVIAEASGRTRRTSLTSWTNCTQPSSLITGSCPPLSLPLGESFIGIFLSVYIIPKFSPHMH